MMHGSDLEVFAHKLADVSGGEITPMFRAHSKITDKVSPLGYDPVTAADQAAENAIRALITTQNPDHGIIGEEYGSFNRDAEYLWVIDPIDGTKSFISGQPIWGTLIALVHNGRASFGLLDQPFLKERYWGNGQKSFGQRNSAVFPLKTRQCPTLADATVFVSSSVARNPLAQSSVERLGALTKMLIYGGDCFSVAMLAEGHIDIAIGWGGFEIYDIAAHIPLVTGAGGIVTALDGSSALNSRGMIAVGDPSLHQQAISVLNWPKILSSPSL